MKFLSKFLFTLFTMYPVALAQTNDTTVVPMQPVIVTADQIKQQSSQIDNTVTSVNGIAFRSLPSFSILEALESSTNIHLQPRAPFGVQSDFSIRGSHFGQQLILIDGMRFNDPQTGHHNSDIALPTASIGHIEVQKTSSSAQYGADAFGGVINFMPKDIAKSQAIFSLAGGERGLFLPSGTVELSTRGISSLNAVEHARSEAYGIGNDFKVTNVSSFNRLYIEPLPFALSILTGYSNKEFGAYHFYVPPTDNSLSREWTETFFASASTGYQTASMYFKPSFLYKIHHDKFVYDPFRIAIIPENVHTSRLYDARVTVMTHIDAVQIVGGMEYTGDDITSSNLGLHSRSMVGIHLSGNTRFEKTISVDAGVRADIHSDYNEQFNPNIGISYHLGEFEKIFFTAGRSFRTPSYTDLYYLSPTTAGNASLNPEIAFSYEVGYEYRINNNKIALSFYRNEQQNMIDYVLNAARYGDRRFHAVNLTRSTIHGADFSAGKQFNDFFLRPFAMINYSYIDSRILLQSSDTSRYAFTHPRHQIGATLVLEHFIGHQHPINASFSAIYKIKLNGTSYTLVNGKISGTYSPFTAYIRGTNLLDVTYQEIVGVTLPGRWLWAGIEYTLSLRNVL